MDHQNVQVTASMLTNDNDWATSYSVKTNLKLKLVLKFIQLFSFVISCVSNVCMVGLSFLRLKLAASHGVASYIYIYIYGLPIHRTFHYVIYCCLTKYLKFKQHYTDIKMR